MISPNFDYFLQIVECKSISRAAERLYISQPALTKYLRNLETDLGIRLFARTQGELKITDAGKYYYEYVQHVKNEERNLRTRISEIQFEGRATLRIGMPLWRSSVMLPDFLHMFLQEYPLISVELMEGSAAKLEAALMNEDVDLCIMNLPVSYANVSYLPVAEEYIYLVGSRENELVKRICAGHPDCAHPNVDIRQFAQQPFVLTKPGQHITEYINTMLSRNDMVLNCILRTSNVTTAVNMAACDLGFTFVPEAGTHSRFFPSRDAVLFTVNDPPMRCTLAAVYKRSVYLSKAAQIFIRKLTEYIDQCREKEG